MKAIMCMFDTLNRHMLPPYGCDWVHAPNFKRLADRAVTFDNCYVGSMPCMPARRELQTGRYNFLHRSWGPIEPFDDSMPELLKTNGVYTHLVTDHHHYWEDGGATYHQRYNSFELIRGQEGDPWKASVNDPIAAPHLTKTLANPLYRQDVVNRRFIREEKDFPQARTFEAGMDFIRANADADRWFVQIETFDPHEPFFAPQQYRDLYPHAYEGKTFDWPNYSAVKETREEVEHCRYEYAALLSMCDNYLGKVLDLMDELALWDDTMLIVNTDHGFLLGEHDQWAKCHQPFYNEVAHTPLFIWDPRSRRAGERRGSLVQMIDMAPTLLDFFGVPIPRDMQGRPLRGTVEVDRPVREYALFGIHGGHVNVTDGRYVYMRGPAGSVNAPLYNYTLMPTHMKQRFSVQELQEAGWREPFEFTKGLRVLQVPSAPKHAALTLETMLFDLLKDPAQQEMHRDPAAEARLASAMIDLMLQNDAPPEQFERLGLDISKHGAERLRM